VLHRYSVVNLGVAEGEVLPPPPNEDVAPQIGVKVPADGVPPEGKTGCVFLGSRRPETAGTPLNTELNQAITNAKAKGYGVHELPPPPCPPKPENAGWEFLIAHPSCIVMAGERNVTAYVWACPGAVVERPPTGPVSKYDPRPPGQPGAAASMPVESKPDLVPVVAGAGVVALVAALVSGVFGGK
jgi:hypothetical protein